MKNPQCEKCLWSDQCYSEDPCDDFSPINENEPSELDDAMIERYRRRFRQEFIYFFEHP